MLVLDTTFVPNLTFLGLLITYLRERHAPRNNTRNYTHSALERRALCAHLAATLTYAESSPK